MQIVISTKITINLATFQKEIALSEHKNSVSEHRNFKMSGVVCPQTPLADCILSAHMI